MEHNAQAPATGPLRRKVTITNPQGLHLRPMRAFVELAGQYHSQVRLQRDQQEFVDGKSMLSLMLLAADQGTELTIEVEGPDAAPALEALAELLINIATRVDVESAE
jgi:phosphocarrier protein